MKLLFVGPLEYVQQSMRLDWNETRATTHYPVIVVVYDLPDPYSVQYASESGIPLCRYSEMDRLEGICRDRSKYLRRQALAHAPSFQGVVDGFDGVSTFYGWVKLLGPDGLLSGLQISVTCGGIQIGTATPDIVRRDISGSDDCATGFRATCSRLVESGEILGQTVFFTAATPNGDVYQITISGTLLGKLQLAKEEFRNRR